MRINVHAGHNPDGKKACGAIGLLRESTEARNVKNEVIRQLKALGHTVYDCTVDDGASSSDVLCKIVKKANAHAVDVDVSIHFNSGRNDTKGDGVVAGTEVYVYGKTSKAIPYANGVADAICDLGYRKRVDSTSPAPGVKVRPSLYVLKHTNSPAILVECCFVDDKDDVQLYDCRSMASAIVYGLTGQHYAEPKEDVAVDNDATRSDAETTVGDSKRLYRVQVGAYSKLENATALQKRLKDAGFDAIVVNA